MVKHAYLIMAHNQEELLKYLISLLDVCENDIYIHLDKKSKISPDTLTKISKKANVIITNRINVEWGGYSQIKATFILLKEALRTSHVYYHMLAGVDLPLKDINSINEFYNNNIGKEFIRFFSYDKSKSEYYRRFGYKNFFRDKFGKRDGIWKIVNKLLYLCQQIFKIRDDSLVDNFYLGASSWDITEELARDLVRNEREIEKKYRWTSCCDEAFLQTFIYNTKYWNNLWIPYSKEDTGMKANMRFIDFSDEKNGSPHTIKKQDIEGLVSSGLNFARKFDLNYIDAIQEMQKYI